MKKSPFVLLVFLLILTISCSTNRTVKFPTPENESRNIRTLEERLLSKPGVFIQNGAIRIRGGDQSFIAGSDPLFEINGQVLSGGYQEARRLVNPSEIKSIRVFKNPEELALYGSRGLNGVIRIRLRNSQGEKTY